MNVSRYVFSVNKVKVELTGIASAEIGPPLKPIMEAGSFSELKKKICHFVAQKGASSVEFTESSVCINTPDLTIWGTIEISK